MVHYDHWIAFILLAAVGVHMIHEGLRGEVMRCEPMTLRMLIALSTATSIDALAVGFSAPLIGLAVAGMSIAAGLTSFILAILGYFMGSRIRGLAGKRAPIFGGAILILLGLRILLEHMG